jgi:copper chaperone CopZ
MAAARGASFSLEGRIVNRAAPMLAREPRSTYRTPMIARALLRSMVLALLVLTLGTSVSCRSTAGVAEAGDGATYVIGVEGMSCAHNCAPKVKEALESIDGVKSAEVSFEEKRAIVKMAAGHDLTREACETSFGNQGYFVSSLALADAAGDAPPAAEAGH